MGVFLLNVCLKMLIMPHQLAASYRRGKEARGRHFRERRVIRSDTKIYSSGLFLRDSDACWARECSYAVITRTTEIKSDA